jgi:SNF2 family DNA or RNA helicase
MIFSSKQYDELSASIAYLTDTQGFLLKLFALLDAPIEPESLFPILERFGATQQNESYPIAVQKLIESEFLQANEDEEISIISRIRPIIFWQLVEAVDQKEIIEAAKKIKQFINIPTLPGIKNNPGEFLLNLLTGEVTPNEDYFSIETNSLNFLSAIPGLYFQEKAIKLLPTSSQIAILIQAHRLISLTFNKYIDNIYTKNLYGYFSKPSWLRSEEFIYSCAHIISEHFIYAAQFERAKSYLGLSDNPEMKALNGLILYLFHGHKAALPVFKTAIAELRVSKQNQGAIFASPLADIFYFLSLLQSSNPSNLAEAQKHLTIIIPQSSVYHSAYQFLSAIYSIKANAYFNRKNIEMAIKTAELGIEQWLACLTSFWINLDNQGIMPHLDSISQETMYPEFKMILAETTRLKRSFGLELNQGEQDLLEDYAQQYTLPLPEILKLQAKWEMTLTELNQTLNLDGAEIPEGNNRLIWEFSIVSKDKFTLKGREQSRLKSGRWSAGKIIDPSKYNYGSKDFPDYYTPQDQTVIEYFKQINAWHMGSKESDWGVFAHLVGHTGVYTLDNLEKPIEIIKGDPILILNQEKDSLIIDFKPAYDEHRFIVEAEGDNKLRVYEFNSSQIKTAEILNKQKEFPLAALDKLTNTLKALSKLMPVHSTLGGTQSISQTATIKASSHIYTRISRKLGNLALTVVVKPFGEQGPAFFPAHGPQDVFTTIAGQKLHTTRELWLEGETLEMLSAQCLAVEYLVPDQPEIFFDSPQEALEALLSLQESELTTIEWLDKKQQTKVSRVSASNLKLSINKMNDWFEIKGEIEVDENKVIELRQLLALYNGKNKFVPIGDDEFIALTDELRQKIEDLKAYTESNENQLLFHRLAVPTISELFEGDERVIFDKAWKEATSKYKTAEKKDFEKPKGFKGKLREYQLDGYKWLSKLAYLGMGACLADDMGLGKTIEALTIILSRAQLGPAFVLAPTSVCTNWYMESKKFAPTLNPILLGPSDRKETIANLKPQDLIICSYGILQKEIGMLAQINWATLILDEAQAIKNMGTIRSQAAMMLQGEFKMLMTGTPIENHLGELWNLFRFLNPGLLGPINKFMEKFGNPIQTDGDAEAKARLSNLIRPFILRRTKSQVLKNLPPKTEITLNVELSEQELELYESNRRQALDNINKNENENKAIVVLAEIMKLRRLCCNPSLVAPELDIKSSKLTLLESIVSDLLENGHKALIFSQFVDHLSIVKEMFIKKNISFKYLDGSTPVKQRNKAINEFQAGEADFFLISLRAGGQGLNLTAADFVIHLDPWWNPAVEDQASDRAHRIGQTKPVTIYKLITSNTIEEKIVQLHGKKRGLADDLLKDTDISGRVSTKELLELITKSAIMDK